MKSDFIPVGNGDMDSFEENLVRKIAVHAPALGLNSDEVNESINIINDHRTAFANMNFKFFLKSVIMYI